MQARDIPKYEAPFQKVSIGFWHLVRQSLTSRDMPVYTKLHLGFAFVRIADIFPSINLTSSRSISTASRVMGLKRFGKGPDAVSMTVRLPY